MFREKLETVILAVSICAVSIVVLLGGMNLGAMQSNGKVETIQNEQNANSPEDVIGTVIDEFSMDSLEEEFANVNIITWDEYYELSGAPLQEEYKRGIYGTLKEESCSMKEAGLLALKEISSLEQLSLDGMYLMMVMSNASSSQAVDMWRGYLCNFLADREPANGKKLEYYIQVNAYTGEIIRLEQRSEVGEPKVLLDTTTKTEVISNTVTVDYSAVPMYTLEEYFQMQTMSLGATSFSHKYGGEGYLSMKEAGTIVLKEIHRLFDEDMIGMKLVMSFSDGKWGGWLLNEYDEEDERYKSYSFRMDARSGKVWWLTGGIRNVNYTKKTAVTDEEIIENARAIIQKYHLANVEKVDWSKVVVYNASATIKKRLEEAREESDVHITNYVEFYTDEGDLMRIETDWETGKLWTVLNENYWYLYE